MRLEPFVRALVVVGSHQPRITRDVGRQDRCKTASSGHGTVTHAPGYLLRGIAPLYRQPACSNILPSRPGGARASLRGQLFLPLTQTDPPSHFAALRVLRPIARWSGACD